MSCSTVPIIDAYNNNDPHRTTSNIFQQWHYVPLMGMIDSNSKQQNHDSNDSSSSSGTKENTILVSNRTVQWNTQAVQTISDFITTTEVTTLQNELLLLSSESSSSSSSESKLSWTTTNSHWEGFDGPRRFVRYYHFSSDLPHMTSTNTTHTPDRIIHEDFNKNTNMNGIPTLLVTLKQRLYETTGLMATHAKIEEYIPLVRCQNNNATPKKNNHMNHSKRNQHHVTSEHDNDDDGDNIDVSHAETWKYDPNMICTFPYQPHHPDPSSGSYFIAEIPITITTTAMEEDDEASNQSSVAATPTTTIPLIQNWNQPLQVSTSSTEGSCSMEDATTGSTATNQRNVLPAAMRWKLQSEHHMTYVHVPYNTLLIRKNDMCTQWRNSRYMYAMNNTSHMNRSNEYKKYTNSAVRVIQFYNFDTNIQHSPHHNDTPNDTNHNNNNSDTFGYVATNIDEMTERTRRLQYHQNNPTTTIPPSMSDLVTILITTSPIKSNPNTDVIEQAMRTFLIGGGPEFAYQCRKVIVCDGFRTMTHAKVNDPTNDATRDNNDDDAHADAESADQPDGTSKDATRKNQVHRVSRRHCNDKQAMRNGIVTEQQAQNYYQYKQNLQQLCQNASTESVFQNTQIVELSSRHGYGYAVRHVLRHTDHIQTPYVCVIQHDRTFMRPTPIQETLYAMWEHTNIKYVGFSMRSNLMYRDIYIAKYGKGTEYDDMILYLPQLQVPSTQYGPNSASTNALSVNNERVKQNILALSETYRGSAQATIECKVTTPRSSVPRTDSDHEAVQSPFHENQQQQQMSLVPTLYWYDNVHICETKQYRDFIFHPSYKMVAKGGFIEDKLSPILKRTVERLGLRDGHSRFGCYLLDDHSGMFFTGHIDGGSYISPEERKELLASQQQEREAK